MAESSPEVPVAIVTGANTGIGRETARQLAERGYHVVLACRNAAAATAAAAEIAPRPPATPNTDARPAGRVEVGPRLDLTCQESVRSFVSAFQAKHSRLDVLVNNAGLKAPMNWKLEDSGVSGMVHVNYLGPFLLTRLLERQLARCNARVVNVSSVMHRVGSIPDVPKFFTSASHGGILDLQGGYSATKLANVVFTNELRRRCRGRLQVCAVDPGGVASDIWRHDHLTRPVLNLLFAPPAEGCAAVVHAASAPWPRPCTRAQPAAGACGCDACAGASDRAGGKAVFLARGLFASPLVTTYGVDNGVAHAVRAVLGVPAAVLDHALRSLLRGGLGMSTTRAVASSNAADSIELGSALWEESCRLSGVPVAMSV